MAGQVAPVRALLVAKGTPLPSAGQLGSYQCRSSDEPSFSVFVGKSVRRIGNSRCLPGCSLPKTPEKKV